MTDWGESVAGETPIPDRSGLRDPLIRTRRELSVAEARNIAKAAVKYLAERPTKRRAPFDLSWCLRLHREMFGDIWDWAGQPRAVELNLGGPASQVSVQLDGLMKDLATWGDFDVDLLERAVRLHHRAVKIHPFLNGNGRWSRMLADIWLRRNGQPIVDWPSGIGEESPIRAEYIAAVKQADLGEMEPLLRMHRRYHGKRP